jgi:hypothetical protein
MSPNLCLNLTLEAVVCGQVHASKFSRFSALATGCYGAG